MRSVLTKRGVLAAVAALALVGAALGVAAAQQTPTPSPTPGDRAPSGQAKSGQERHEQFLNAVAAKLGVSADRLRQAMDEARRELGLPERSAGEWHGRAGGPIGEGLSVAANALGISVDQLRQELAGKTLADVARAHNVDPATVARALKDAANARIDRAASAGRIPSDQVAQIKQQIAERIDQLMTRQVPTGGLPTGGPHRSPGAFSGR